MTSSHFEKTVISLVKTQKNLEGEEDETDRKVYCKA